MFLSLHCRYTQAEKRGFFLLFAGHFTAILYLSNYLSPFRTKSMQHNNLLLMQSFSYMLCREILKKKIHSLVTLKIDPDRQLQIRNAKTFFQSSTVRFWVLLFHCIEHNIHKLCECCCLAVMVYCSKASYKNYLSSRV